ncbi:MAG: hypothetical protein ACTS27_07910 [Phycisphaerales bacterium]
MAQHTQKHTQADKPAKDQNRREGDEPQDIREAKPNHGRPESEDRGRDRNPGDMRRDEDDQSESDETLTDAAEQDDEFEGEDETDASDGSHMRNPKPRTR